MVFRRLKTALSTALLAALYTSSILVNLNDESVWSEKSQYIRAAITLASMSGIFIMIFFSNLTEEFWLKTPVHRRSSALLAIWLLFSSVIIISQAAILEFPLEGIVFALNIGTLFALAPALSQNPSELILKAALLSSVFVIVYSLIYFPVTNIYVSYSGLLDNPNPFSQVALIGTLSACCLAVNALKYRRLVVFCFYVLVGLSAFGIMIILTKSRTSFAACIIVLLSAWALFNLQQLIKSFFVAGAILIVVLVYYWSEILSLGAIQKTITLAAENNILNNRVGSWHEAGAVLDVFGRSREVARMYLVDNSFISIALRFGIFSGIGLAFLYVVWLVSSVRFAFRNRLADYYFVPFMFVLCFFLISFTENVVSATGAAYFVILYSAVGVLMYSPRR